MKATLDQVSSNALALSPNERAALTRRLIKSLEVEPEENAALVEQSWQAEVALRVDEIKSGKVQGIPADEVFAKLRAKYG